MASSDTRSGATPSLWRRWFGPRPKADPCPQATPAEEEAVDLIDQAEAFQTLRIRDVMTPRADIVALEISLPLDEVVRLTEAHGLVLTPHVLGPIPRDGLLPAETTILLAGMYNLGFIGVGDFLGIDDFQR